MLTIECLNSAKKPFMLTNHAGKLTFSGLHPEQRKRRFKIIVAALLLFLIVAGFVVVKIVWSGAEG